MAAPNPTRAPNYRARRAEPSLAGQDRQRGVDVSFSLARLLALSLCPEANIALTVACLAPFFSPQKPLLRPAPERVNSWSPFRYTEALTRRISSRAGKDLPIKQRAKRCCDKERLRMDVKVPPLIDMQMQEPGVAVDPRWELFTVNQAHLKAFPSLRFASPMPEGRLKAHNKSLSACNIPEEQQEAHILNVTQ